LAAVLHINKSKAAGNNKMLYTPDIEGTWTLHETPDWYAGRKSLGINDLLEWCSEI